MENMRINVRQAYSDTYNGNPYIAFAGIMTGLLSVILFVDELDAVSFTVVGVLLFSGIYAYILSYAHYNKRKFLPFVIVGEVAVTAILSVFNIQRISEQSVSIIQALVDGRANTQNVTYVVFVSSVVLIYIIYLLEVIFKKPCYIDTGYSCNACSFTYIKIRGKLVSYICNSYASGYSGRVLRCAWKT